MSRTPARANWTLVAAVLGSSMSFIDGTAVNVALPVLQHELHASAAQGQWVIEGYALFLSALILIGGALGDLYGRRFVYGAGIALFAVASVVCACAPTAQVLIAGRCLQGVGGALATPGSLALISAAFGGAERGKAIGTWSGFSAITSAIGPLLGGWLVQYASWRWVFVINVPIALAVLAILVFAVDESRDETAVRGLDGVGAALATVGLGGVVYGLIRLQGAAGDAAGIGAVLAGLAACAAFFAWEARARHPMVPLRLFASRRFSAANAYTFLLYAALGGSFYFLPFDLINVQGYAPSAAGAALLPMILISFSLSRYSGGLVAKTGPRPPLVAGALLAAAGFAIFAFAGVGHSYWTTFFPGMVVLGFAVSCFAAPLTTTVMDALESSRAGVASGINNAVARTAGLVAIAALGIVLAAIFHASLERELAHARLSAPTRVTIARDAAQIVAGRVPSDIRDGPERRIVGAAIRNAFARGFRFAMLAAALLSALAAAVALGSAFAQSVPAAGLGPREPVVPPFAPRPSSR